MTWNYDDFYGMIMIEFSRSVSGGVFKRKEM
jgi:hypothetical protein